MSIRPLNVALAALLGLIFLSSGGGAIHAEQATGTLQGLVYYDKNGNGQRDANEVTLANASVSAAPTGAAIGNRANTAIADATGHYQLTVPAGELSVMGSLGAKGTFGLNGTSGTVFIRTTVPAGQVITLDLGIRPPTPAPTSYFPETGFSIGDPAIQAYFHGRGGVDTFGYPVSGTFRLLGFTVQVFQREVLQVFPDGSVHPMNLLDPGLFDVTSVNFSTFPAYDLAVAAAAPPPNTPDYGQAVLAYLQQSVPDTFDGQPVHFLQTYMRAAAGSGFPALVALEVYGFPTSRPAYDPNNRNFVYQRFQRGILHYDATVGATRGILLADAFKGVITGQALPADVAAEQQSSRFFQQYCPGPVGWRCRPEQVPDTDLTFAFEQEQAAGTP